MTPFPTPLNYHHALTALGAGLVVLSVLALCVTPMTGRAAVICAVLFLVGIFMANL